MKTKTIKKPRIVHRRKRVRKAMTNQDEKKPTEAQKPTDVDQKKPTEAPPTVEQFGHKNPPVGPTTGKPLADWNKSRDYENFNPTAEK
jgi:hypothetical protein